MNTMTLEIHRSSKEEDLFVLVSRLVKELSGPESEVLGVPSDQASTQRPLPLGPWTLRLHQQSSDRTRTFYEVLSVACQRFQSRLSATQCHLSKRQNEVLPSGSRVPPTSKSPTPSASAAAASKSTSPPSSASTTAPAAAI